MVDNTPVEIIKVGNILITPDMQEAIESWQSDGTGGGAKDDQLHLYKALAFLSKIPAGSAGNEEELKEVMFYIACIIDTIGYFIVK